jgi:hypothetical protein
MPGASGTLTTGAFSPPANSVVVCMTSLGWDSSPSALTVTDSSDANATTWTKVEGLGSGTNNGCSTVAYRKFVSAPGSISVRVVDATGGFDQFIYIKTLTGVDMTTPTGATVPVSKASTNAYTTSITTTAVGSYVAGIVDESTTSFSSATFTAAAASTVLAQWDNGPGDGTATGAFKQTALTSSPGATTLGVTCNITSPGSMALVEFMPAGAGGAAVDRLAPALPLGFSSLLPPTPMALASQVTLGDRYAIQAYTQPLSATLGFASTGSSISAPWVGTAVGGNVAGTAGTSTTVDVSGATNGQVCWIFGFLGDAELGNITAPAGWTNAGQTFEGATGVASCRMVAFWKVKQSTDTTVTITDATNWTFSTKNQWVPISWPGVDTTVPFENLTWATRSAGSITTYATATATPTGTNRWAVGLFGARGTTSAVAFTPDAALVERVDAVYTGTPFVGIEVADSNGAVTQAGHTYTATGQAASHAAMGLLYLIPSGSDPLTIQTRKTLPGAILSFTSSDAFLTSKLINATLSFTGSIATFLTHGGTLFTQALNATLSFTSSQTLRTSKQLGAGSVSFTSSQTRRTAKTVAGATIGWTSSQARSVAKGISATLSFTGSRTSAHLFAQALSATLGFTSSQSRRVVKGLAGSVGFTSSQTRAIAKVAMAAAVGFTSSQTRRVAKGISATVGFTSSQARLVAKGISATLSFTGSMSALAVHHYTQALNATVGFTGSLATSAVHVFTQALNATLGFTSSQTRRVAKIVAGATVGFTSSQTRRVAKQLGAGGLGFTSSQTRLIGKQLAATVSFTSSQARRISKGLSATLGSTGNLATVAVHLFTKALNATVGFTGSLSATRLVFKALSATVGFTSSQTRRTGHAISAGLSFTSSQTRRISKRIVASLPFAGVLTTISAASYVAARKALAAIRNVASSGSARSSSSPGDVAGGPSTGAARPTENDASDRPTSTSGDGE